MKSQPEKFAQSSKKILYIITQGSWGGAQKYVFDLATGVEDNFDITIAIGELEGNKDLQAKIKSYGSEIKIIQLKHLVRNISPFHDMLAIFELRKLYKQINPDIIHLNSSKAGILGSIAKFNILRSTFKVLYTAHGWVFNEPLSKTRKSIYKFLEKITAKFKDVIIVLSKHDKNIATNTLAVPEKKLYTIPLGIDPSKNVLSKEEAKKQISELSNQQINEMVIGTIANLYKTKGLDVLCKAIAEKKEELKNVQFVIIGEGPERNNLESLISNLNLKNVHLLGYIKNASKYLNAFDIFVLPSKKEGFPYVLLEVLHSGVPIVTTDVGGISEIIRNRETGLLVPPNEPRELANAIVFATNNKDAVQKFANEAHSELKKYSKNNMLEQTTQLYNSILQQT